MTFAKALQRAQKKAEKKGKKINIKIPPLPSVSEDFSSDQVPRMYRAQVEGRCSLQFAGERNGKTNQDLEEWTKEWVDPISDSDPQPRYQRQEPTLGWDGSVYRLKISFPWRVCSNCGADSILRPVLGKDGIPFFPGSGVKGLFRRLLNSEQLDESTRRAIEDYCGNPEKRGHLRFHGAYPIGDWAGAEQVTQQSDSKSKISYRMADVVHPQQSRQVEGKGKASVFTLITLFQPTLIFELSSSRLYTKEQWKQIAGLLKRALSHGLGGKTSSGYGLWVIPKNYALRFDLKGVGVSSLLRSNEPEFRLNMFKASLRGHASRLLAGVCAEPKLVKEKVNKLFGHTSSPGCAQLYWEWQPKDLEIGNQGNENTPIYRVKGSLHIDVDRGQVSNNSDYQQNLDFLRSLFQFSYVMGGFGKSWRRIWHEGPDAWKNEFQGFFSYKTRAIGCHWQYSDSFELKKLTTRKALEDFLDALYQTTQRFIAVKNPQAIEAWRESWHPKRVSVYCSDPVSHSSIVKLFHQGDSHPFKTTPAICGKSIEIKEEDGKKKEVLNFYFSSIWHRMLPIGKDPSGKEQYLEIVTLFHGDRRPWERNGVDQLIPFVEQLEANSLTLAWGTRPSSSNGSRKSSKRI